MGQTKLRKFVDCFSILDRRSKKALKPTKKLAYLQKSHEIIARNFLQRFLKLIVSRLFRITPKIEVRGNKISGKLSNTGNSILSSLLGLAGSWEPSSSSDNNKNQHSKNKSSNTVKSNPKPYIDQNSVSKPASKKHQSSSTGSFSKRVSI